MNHFLEFLFEIMHKVIRIFISFYSGKYKTQNVVFERLRHFDYISLVRNRKNTLGFKPDFFFYSSLKINSFRMQLFLIYSSYEASFREFIS